MPNLKFNHFKAQGKLVDATQEFIALGMSNLVGSFFHSMPVAASFGRTAVNSASSVKTTLVMQKFINEVAFKT